jgi:(p)ppGpp synthase/HD superfamily hydrolase
MTPMTQEPTDRVPATVVTHRFSDAVEYAAELHADQVRKGTDVAYLSHLLGVAGLVLEAGGDEEMAIAGLLHDAAEDQGGESTLQEIERRFGPRVARIVRGCSDTLVADRADKEEYGGRKARYLEGLALADVDTVTVSAADKVHNARSLVTDLRLHGLDVMAKFSGTPVQILAYYRACLEISIDKGVPATLTDPLAVAVVQLAELLGSGDGVRPEEQRSR